MMCTYLQAYDLLCIVSNSMLKFEEGKAGRA
jgi:hypothetical protein